MSTNSDSLTGPDSLQPPDDGGGKGDCGDEVFDVAVEAGGYTAPVLEAAKHALDDVALPVDGLVIMVLDLAVLARWDDGRGSAFCQPVAQGFAVIALVGDESGGGRHGFDTALGDLAIMDVSWCQEQDEGPALRIADNVELGVAVPLGAADAMGQGPPFPPPAQR